MSVFGTTVEAGVVHRFTEGLTTAEACGCAACGGRPPPEPLPLDVSDAQPLDVGAQVTPVSASGMDAEITFLSGVTALSRTGGPSYWTYNSPTNPATYNQVTSRAHKFGPGAIGSASGDITYNFTAASNWTSEEKAAWVSAMTVWSSVANVNFVETATAAGARLKLTRGTDGSAYATGSFTSSLMNSTTVGGYNANGATVSLDTSVPGFGPVTSNVMRYGGYVWGTMVHELGHAIGLGHAGPYNGQVDPTTQQYGKYDSLLYSIMSYINPAVTTATNYEAGTDWGRYTDTTGSGTPGNYRNSATTPMVADILAVQRLYGAPTSALLDGGEVFGFNTNITGALRPFFDFTTYTSPVVTLFSTGLNNTFDLSGFDTNSVIDLNPGAFSSAGRAMVSGQPMTNNIGVDVNTRIDTAIGGSGADTITGNAWNNRLVGNGGADTLSGGFGLDVLYGGVGNDVLYGNQDADVLYGDGDNDALYGGQGADVAYGGAGDDAVYGNLGDDVLFGGAGINFLDGGGNDAGGDTLSYADAAAGVTVSLAITTQQVTGASVDTIIGFENLTGSAYADHLTGDGLANVISSGFGADIVYGGFGNDVLYGNQDDDILYGNQDNDVLYGGQGADALYGGQGDDVLWGGLGADILAGNLAADRFLYLTANDSTVAASDAILGFVAGEDRIDLRLIRTGTSDNFAFLPDGAGGTVLSVDLGGNGTVDVRILIIGASASALDLDWG